MSKFFLLAGALTLLAVPAVASSTTSVSSNTSTSTTTNVASINADADITAQILPADRRLFDADNNGVITRNEFSARLPQIDTNGNGRIESLERANFIGSMPGNLNTRGAATAQAQADAGARPTADASTSSHSDNISVRSSAESALGTQQRVVTTTRSSTARTLNTLSPAADVHTVTHIGGNGGFFSLDSGSALNLGLNP